MINETYCLKRKKNVRKWETRENIRVPRLIEGPGAQKGKRRKNSEKNGNGTDLLAINGRGRRENRGTSLEVTS